MSISPNVLIGLRDFRGSSIEASFVLLQVPVKTLRFDAIEAPQMTLALEHCGDEKVSPPGWLFANSFLSLLRFTNVFSEEVGNFFHSPRGGPVQRRSADIIFGVHIRTFCNE